MLRAFECRLLPVAIRTGDCKLSVSISMKQMVHPHKLDARSIIAPNAPAADIDMGDTYRRNVVVYFCRRSPWEISDSVRQRFTAATLRSTRWLQNLRDGAPR